MIPLKDVIKEFCTFTISLEAAEALGELCSLYEKENIKIEPRQIINQLLIEKAKDSKRVNDDRENSIG